MKFFIFLFFVGLSSISIWLSNHPGTVSIDWMGYNVETYIGVLFLIIGAASLGLNFFMKLVKFIYQSPKKIYNSWVAYQQRRAYKAFTKGMVAIAAGDGKEASAQAKKTSAIMSEQPLVLLLSAQSARMQGDEEKAEHFYRLMVERPDTAFLGYRGLVVTASKHGDFQKALDYAYKAYNLNSKAPWVLKTLFDLNLRLGSYASAEQVLKEIDKRKLINSRESRQLHAIMLYEIAKKSGEDPIALLKKAHTLAPEFITGTCRLAELYQQEERTSKAIEVLEKTWKVAPHPDVAKVYLDLCPSKNELDRYQHALKLKNLNPDHKESRILLAETALMAELWGEARTHLKPLLKEKDKKPSLRVCQLMARVEEAEHNNTAEAKKWLAKIVKAPVDNSWICGQCGSIADSWQPMCKTCDSFNTLGWQTPTIVTSEEEEEQQLLEETPNDSPKEIESAEHKKARA